MPTAWQVTSMRSWHDGGMYLGDTRWPEVLERPGVLLIPLGSCEQHGPHLPLDTDTRIAAAVAGVVASTRPRIRVAPAVAYGASGEHAAFAGTLSLGSDVLTMVIIELVRSADWAERVVLVNGHGGNVDGLRSAIRTLTAEGRPVDVWSPTIAGGDAHAGHTETSLMLAIAPETVRMDAAEVGATQSITALLPALRAGGVHAVSPNGVLGDPTGATADHGRKLLVYLVASLAATVDRL
jgi:mycofactocin precursor peptide peptidase